MLRADIDIELAVEGPFLTQSTAPGGYGLDAVAARDADGVLCVHGTHVAGKLRQAWEELRCALGDSAEEDKIPSAKGIKDLLGDQIKEEGESEPKFKRLYFSDFRLADPAPGKGVRYRIGIDDDRGAVRKGAQFALDSPFPPGRKARFSGTLRFLATSEAEAERIRNQVECGLQWVPQLGADRSTGFGRLSEVNVGEVHPKPVKIAEQDWKEATGFDLALQPDGPFCIGRRQVDGNLFESLEEIPGNVILGCLARSLQMLSGNQRATLAPGSDGDPFGKLREHFNALRIGHGFPGGECLRRPVRPPLSLVRAEGLYDVALLEEPCLIGSLAPAFSVDWKDDGGVPKQFGWPPLRKEMRVRTAIDPAILRSKESELFAYEMIVPDGRCWYARVRLSGKVPAEDRQPVLDQLAALLALGLFGLGKTKTTARAVVHPAGTVLDTHEMSGIEPGLGEDGLLVITLQTPALLCGIDGLNETSGAAELRKAYATAWRNLCENLELLRYFARQTLSGGEYQHRRFRSGETEPYRPWLLTEAGSVFVFRVKDRPKAGEHVREWLEHGLPLPEPVRRCYAIADDENAQWKSCPFIRRNGYGEISVNLDIHKQLPPSSRTKPISVIRTPEGPQRTVEEPANGDDMDGSDHKDSCEVPSPQPFPGGRGSELSFPSASSDKKQRRPWPFRTRWRVEGCLFTLAPLHIGSGETTDHPDLKDGAEPVKINACAKDHAGKPCLPGSAVKGVLRAWLRSHGVKTGAVDEALFEQVFGRDAKPKKSPAAVSAAGSAAPPTADDEEDPGMGGAAEFHDARLGIARTGDTPLPYWRKDPHTYVEVSTCIDRRTRTVAENKLFHLETVPAGVGFKLIITGFSDSVADSERQIGLLLAALEGFNHPKDPVTLGADTASGKGRCRWEPGGIYRMDKNQVHEWVANPARGMAGPAMPALQPEKAGQLRDAAKRSIPFPAGARESLVLKIRLRFDGLFLVNDPPSERELEVPQEMKPPHARPRVNEMGRAVLPAKSFRGALRSQAERIIRTLGGYACNPGDTEQVCKGIHRLEDFQAVRTAEEKSGLCLACRLFGAPGWKTPLEISDFTLKEGTGEPMTQEFIAIDRFTGGGKGGAKFNARGLYRPVFDGCIELDLGRLHHADRNRQEDGDWETGLLALVLRDLIEGDITFGYGASKGYGACTAVIDRWKNAEFRDNATKGLAVFRGKIAQDPQPAIAGDQQKQAGDAA